jgi:hypothetical protein
MNRYVWRYILQNYNYKLHFQNLSIYHIPHVSIGTLATENLDVCTAWCHLPTSKPALKGNSTQVLQDVTSKVAFLEENLFHVGV